MTSTSQASPSDGSPGRRGPQSAVGPIRRWKSSEPAWVIWHRLADRVCHLDTAGILLVGPGLTKGPPPGRSILGHFVRGGHLLTMESTVLDATDLTFTVSQAASGDEAAFARLIAQHHEPMVRAAYVVVGDVELAREAAQAAWVIAWKRLPSLREPHRVRPWLVAICANEARQLVRRHKRREVMEIKSVEPSTSSNDPADEIDVVDLRRALVRLKPDERSLLAMRYVGGLDSNEIAQQVGMTASGVRSRLARAVERLRRDLDGA